MILIELFAAFFKTGLFAVGGGLATLPFLYEIANTKAWITLSDISDLVAVSEATPGPLGVNMATYAGFIKAGIPGALSATLGLVTPSVIVIIIVAGFLKKFKTSFAVKSVFYGLRAASCALVVSAWTSAVRLAFFGSGTGAFMWQGLLLALGLIAVKKIFKCHPIVLIALSAVAGIIFKFGA